MVLCCLFMVSEFRRSFTLCLVILILVRFRLVADWPPFGKVLLTRLTICSLCILIFVNLVISRFGFEGGFWVLIALVPGHCILVTFKTYYL